MLTSDITSQQDHPVKQIILGAQMLCVAFGALVLVPNTDRIESERSAVYRRHRHADFSACYGQADSRYSWLPLLRLLRLSFTAFSNGEFRGHVIRSFCGGSGLHTA